MPTTFPTTLDALVNPLATDDTSVVEHDDQHSNANDAVEALEAKVGVNASAVASSLDYQMENHAHTGASDDGAVLANDHAQVHSGADHTDPAAPTTVDIGDSAAAGTGTNPPAADDHVHGFPAPGAGYPVDVGAAEADGVATTPARSDHAHAHGVLTTDVHTNYVLESLVDAKGDIFVASAVDTPARLPVGANTAVLQADSAQATGLLWVVTRLWTAIVKSADESVTSSTVLQPDDHLTFTPPNTGMYLIEFILKYGAAAFGAGDLKCEVITAGSWATDNGSFGEAMGVSTTQTLVNTTVLAASTTQIFNSASAGIVFGGGGGATQTAFIRVFAYMWAAGAVTLNWAQNTSSTTATSVKAGSLLRYTRMDI